MPFILANTAPSSIHATRCSQADLPPGLTGRPLCSVCTVSAAGNRFMGSSQQLKSRKSHQKSVTNLYKAHTSGKSSTTK